MSLAQAVSDFPIVKHMADLVIVARQKKGFASELQQEREKAYIFDRRTANSIVDSAIYDGHLVEAYIYSKRTAKRLFENMSNYFR